MKKTILILIFTAFQLLIYGQEYNTTLGIKLGPGITTLYSPIIQDIHYTRFSAFAGIEVRQRIFKDKLYIETGLNLIDRGYKLNPVTLTDETGRTMEIGKSSSHLIYLSLPVSLMFKFKGFFIGAGPNLNYLAAYRLYYNGELLNSKRGSLDYYFDYGAQLYLGYEFILTNRLLLSLDGYGNAIFRSHLMNYGFGIGLKYVLVKHEK